MVERQKRPRAVVIVNPNAGRLPERTRRDVVAALRARVDVDVLWSTRDTGIPLAREAADEGVDVLVAFGGDGHVNEITNGIAGTSTTLGIIPGGTMNVFSRTLGIPQDPFDAVDHLVTRLHSAPRVVPLGRMDGRYFTFSAGCGFDARAAERVESHLDGKRRFGEVFFYWSAVRVLAQSVTQQRKPLMRVRGDFGEVPVAMAIACNCGPYAYFGSRPVHLAPDVRLEAGVDVFAMRTMRLEALPLYMWRVAFSGDLIHHRDAFYARDLESFEIVADEPFSRHVDGEPLGETNHASFSIAPRALRVLA
jgi:diacylglycerol kinase family enzyme